MMLDGFGIAGFRSFGAELVRINDLAKVNVFIGKNNSGKSNILRFCKHLSGMRLGTAYKGFDPELDYCHDPPTKNIEFSLQIKRGPSATAEIYRKIWEIFSNTSTDLSDVWAEGIWFDFSVRLLANAELKSQPGAKALQQTILQKCGGNITNSITESLCGYTGASEGQRALDIAAKLLQFAFFSCDVHLIGAFRRITHEDTFDYSGRGLVGELRKLQNPPLRDYEVNKRKFATINSFLQKLLAEPRAYLEVPAEENEIYVSIRDKVLPLNSLGTGIHELIILAAAVTITEDAVFCIEEPEIHMHPEFQKKFVQYIQHHTTNQYLISTHSNAFLEIEGVNIYHCRLVNGHTKCDLVRTYAEKSSLLSDLGYKASDILQANYIIWVEGPSDRIYIKHWLNSKAQHFVEGLHYSIMFYGGRLLSHLAFNDPQIQEFIQLCRLNRNAAIVIDSDKQSPYTRLNKTKKRVMDNFTQNGAHVWITRGKTIENYSAEDAFNQAIEQAHPKRKRKFKWDRFADLTRLNASKTIDKVAVAKRVTSVPANYSMLDLNKQVDNLIDKILLANK